MSLHLYTVWHRRTLTVNYNAVTVQIVHRSCKHFQSSEHLLINVISNGNCDYRLLLSTRSQPRCRAPLVSIFCHPFKRDMSLNCLQCFQFITWFFTRNIYLNINPLLPNTIIFNYFVLMSMDLIGPPDQIKYKMYINDKKCNFFISLYIIIFHCHLYYNLYYKKYSFKIYYI